MKIDDLYKILCQAWSKETAFGDWRYDCPEMNQCAITALVVQDFMGGKIMRCEMTDGDSHYWNRLLNYKEVDITEKQFQYIEGKPLRDTAEYRTRQYILSFPKTMKRYGLLLQRIADVRID